MPAAQVDPATIQPQAPEEADGYDYAEALSADAIFAADDLAIVRIPVPEWRPGGYVYVRTLTGTERDRFEQAVSDQRRGRAEVNIRAELAVRACCDADGHRIFRDDQAGQLGCKNAAALDRIWDAAAALSGLSQSDERELAKNSGSGPSAASISA